MRTRTRGQVRTTQGHNEAIHDARTQRRHQPTEKKKSGRHERSQRRDDQIVYQRTKKHLLRFYNNAIKLHMPPPPNWRDTTIKVRYKSGDLASPIKLPTHLFDPHLVQTLQPTSQRTLDDNFLAADQAGFRPGHFHDRPPLHVPATPTKSHRVAPAAVGRSHRLQESFRQSGSTVWATLREEGVEEHHTYNNSQKLSEQLRAAVHTDVKKTNSSTSSEEPSRETRPARSYIQLIAAIHHENNSRKV